MTVMNIMRYINKKYRLITFVESFTVALIRLALALFVCMCIAAMVFVIVEIFKDEGTFSIVWRWAVLAEGVILLLAGICCLAGISMKRLYHGEKEN